MKKLNLLLTISVVSIFISLILIIVGNKNNYCLSFGFIFLAVSLALFVADRSIKLSEQIEQNNRFILDANEDLEDDQEIIEAEMENKKLIKMRTSFIMGAVVFGLLLVVLAFTIII